MLLRICASVILCHCCSVLILCHGCVQWVRLIFFMSRMQTPKCSKKNMGSFYKHTQHHAVMLPRFGPNMGHRLHNLSHLRGCRYRGYIKSIKIANCYRGIPQFQGEWCECLVACRAVSRVACRAMSRLGHVVAFFIIPVLSRCTWAERPERCFTMNQQWSKVDLSQSLGQPINNFNEPRSKGLYLGCETWLENTKSFQTFLLVKPPPFKIVATLDHHPSKGKQENVCNHRPDFQSQSNRFDLRPFPSPLLW